MVACGLLAALAVGVGCAAMLSHHPPAWVASAGLAGGAAAFTAWRVVAGWVCGMERAGAQG